MAVCIGANQAAGDLGAIDRCRQRAKGMIHRGNIEPPEMKQLQNIWILQHRAQVRGLSLADGHLHDMRIAISTRHLHHAQPVAMGV